MTDADMVRCKECGKFYNRAISKNCPYCAGGIQPTEPVGVRPGNPNLDLDDKIPKDPKTTKVNNGQGFVGAVPVLEEDVAGFDPIVGWLVAVDGLNRGRAFEIRSQRNFIGREKGDIIIQEDDTISRENHAVVTYDPDEKIFYITPGESRNIIRYNGKALLQSAELKIYDRIEMGQTTLLFIPLCGEAFDWKTEEN